MELDLQQIQLIRTPDTTVNSYLTSLIVVGIGLYLCTLYALLPVPRQQVETEQKVLLVCILTIVFI